jgi:hypothetical protein
MAWAPPDRWDDAAPRLVPLLRPPTSPANAWLAALDDADGALVRVRVAPFVDAVLALDLPDVRLFVRESHLATWGVDRGTAWAAAIAALAPTGAPIPLDGTPGVWAAPAEDGLPSSRLAAPDRVRLPAGGMGSPVAFLPDAGALWLVDADDGAALQAALTRAWDRWNEAGTPISPVPYALLGGRAAPWEPPADHPLVHRVGVAARFLAGAEYRTQQQPLAGWLLERGDPTWVAPYSLIRHRTGRVVSFACWPDGPTLLPRVDLVVLGPPDDGAVDRYPVVPWTALRALGVLGDPEPGLAPDRVRVERHPAAASLRGLTVDPRAWSPLSP